MPNAIVKSKKLETWVAVTSDRAECVVPRRNVALLTDASSRMP
jgi:hypothetical protein